MLATLGAVDCTNGTAREPVAATVAGTARPPVVDPPAQPVGSCEADSQGAEALLLGNTSLTEEERKKFFHLSEGSELFPVDWLLALRVKETGAKFLDTNHPGYGLLKDTQDPNWNPASLPVGMTSASSISPGLEGVPMFGFNCAACHVGQVSAEGKTYRIIGAPGMFDINSFIDGFRAALDATIASSDALAQFLRDLEIAGGTALVKNPGSASRALARTLPASAVLEKGSAASQALLLRLEEIRCDEIAGADAAIRKSCQRGPTTPVKPGYSLSHGKRMTTEEVARNRQDLLGKRLTKALARRDASGSLADQVDGLKGTSAADQVAAVTQFLANFQQSLREFVARRMTLPKDEGTFAGSGRVDAFGKAHNLIFALEDPRLDDPWALNAPVDYPRLWNLAQMKHFHWDGNSTSIVERNVGQSIGLGASPSTVRFDNILELENLARKIDAPKWPFAAPDSRLVTEGGRIFDSRCKQCHDSEAGKTYPDIGTDANRVTSFSRNMKGGTPYFAALEAALVTVIGVACSPHSSLPANSSPECKPAPGQWNRGGAYLARTLSGVWATAPYLHNGSVPSLDALLSPVEKRPDQFSLGDGRLDLASVGSCGPEQGTNESARSTLESGNSKLGHVTNPPLGDGEKRALIAYLKTL